MQATAKIAQNSKTFGLFAAGLVKFLEAVEKEGAQILGLSALLTTTLPSVKKVIEAFRESGMRERIKIMVGGAPVTREYADSIGADGYGENASEAVTLAKRLLAGSE